MLRYELSDGTSHKFWAVELRGRVLRVRYGRIGTEGQTLDKTFASGNAAKQERDRLVKEKTRKGYARATVRAKTSASEPREPKKPRSARPLPLIELSHFTLGGLDVKKALREPDRARALLAGGTVPKALLRLRRVTSLDLGRNPPPPWLAKLRHLRVLKSRAKELETVPSVVFELPKLKELYLDDSGIRSLVGLERAPALEKLTFSRTALSTSASTIAALAETIPGARPSREVPGLDIARKQARAPKRKAALVRLLTDDALPDDADLRGADLRGAHFDDLVLGQDFRRAKLANTVWRRCDFSSAAQFAGADLTGAVFEDCYFEPDSRASMKGVKAPGVTFRRCGGQLVLQAADLRDARLLEMDPNVRLDLRKAKAQRIELQLTVSCEVQFEVEGAEADLRGAHVSFALTPERRRALAKARNPNLTWKTGQFRGAKTDDRTRIVYAALPESDAAASPVIDPGGPVCEATESIDSGYSLLSLLVVDSGDAASLTAEDFARAWRGGDAPFTAGHIEGVVCNVAESGGSSYIFRTDDGVVLFDFLCRTTMPEPELKRALGLRVAQFPLQSVRRIGSVKVRSGQLGLLIPHERGARVFVPVPNGNYDVVSHDFAPTSGYADELGQYWGAIRIRRRR